LKDIDFGEEVQYLGFPLENKPNQPFNLMTLRLIFKSKRNLRVFIIGIIWTGFSCQTKLDHRSLTKTKGIRGGVRQGYLKVCMSFIEVFK